MYENTEYFPNVLVDLSNGLYVFLPKSATGKTRLFTHLRTIQVYDEAIATFTYSDKSQGRSVEQVLVPGKYKLIMLDRYDMYNGDGAELLAECAKGAIILVDCKSGISADVNEDLALIDMSPAKIVVSQ